MTQSKHDRILAVVDHFKNDQPVTQDMQSTMMAEEMQLAADALTALLEENSTLRTEKHADSEAIGALRDEIERLREALTHIDALDPESGVKSCSVYALRGLVNRMGEIARAALKGSGQ